MLKTACPNIKDRKNICRGGHIIFFGAATGTNELSEFHFGPLTGEQNNLRENRKFEAQTFVGLISQNTMLQPLNSYSLSVFVFFFLFLVFFVLEKMASIPCIYSKNKRLEFKNRFRGRWKIDWKIMEENIPLKIWIRCNIFWFELNYDELSNLKSTISASGL